MDVYSFWRKFSEQKRGKEKKGKRKYFFLESFVIYAGVLVIGSSVCHRSQHIF